MRRSHRPRRLPITDVLLSSCAFALWVLCSVLGGPTPVFAELPGVESGSYVRATAGDPHPRCRPELPGSAELCMAAVDAAGERALGAVLASYDAHLARNPKDHRTAVERCLFMQRVALAELEEDSPRHVAFDACIEGLIRERGNVPEVLILQLQQRFGDGAAEFAAELLARTPSPFSLTQRAEILEYVARQLQFSDPERASDFAQQAMAVDEKRALETIAAAALRKTDPDAAAKILLSSLDEVRDSQFRIEAATMLIELGYPSQAVGVFDELAGEGVYLSRLSHARALAASGYAVRARAMFDAAADQLPWLQGEILEERFRFELEFGTTREASVAYEALRDAGFDKDPLLRRRSELWWTHPSAPFHARDLLGLLTFLAYVLSGFGLAALFLCPIHYVGLLRGRGRHPDFMGERRFGLRHLWLALGTLGTLELLIVWGFCYELVAGYFDVRAPAPEDPSVWARVTLMSSPLGLLVLLAMLRREDYARLSGARWRLSTSLLVGGVSSGAVFLVSMFNFLLLTSCGWAAAALSSQEVLTALMREYGVTVFALVVVIAAPVSEELLFREIGLRALSRYLDFGVANLLQSLVFASLHQDPVRFLPLFALGFLAGWLRRRSGSLLAPMMLHATNNAIAVAVMSSAG